MNMQEEMIEVAALPALFIILIGIVPVFIANHVLAASYWQTIIAYVGI